MHSTTMSNHNKCNNNSNPQYKDLNFLRTRPNAVVPHRLKRAPVNEKAGEEPPETLFDLIPEAEIYTGIVLWNILKRINADLPV